MLQWRKCTSERESERERAGEREWATLPASSTSPSVAVEMVVQRSQVKVAGNAALFLLSLKVFLNQSAKQIKFMVLKIIVLILIIVWNNILSYPLKWEIEREGERERKGEREKREKKRLLAAELDHSLALFPISAVIINISKSKFNQMMSYIKISIISDSENYHSTHFNDNPFLSWNLHVTFDRPLIALAEKKKYYIYMFKMYKINIDI